MFVVNRSSVSIPMYEFPCSFNSGLQTAMLSLPGMIATTPPPHAAFSRHSHAESELPGFVVETAGQHECAEAFRAAHGEDSLVVVWVGPVVGQEQE